MFRWNDKHYSDYIEAYQSLDFRQSKLKPPCVNESIEPSILIHSNISFNNNQKTPLSST